MIPSTYGSTAISDTGLDYVPKGIDLATTWRPLPNGHSNGTTHMQDEPPAGPGHNSGVQEAPAKHSFQDNADELIRVGRIVTSFRRIGLAIRDRRCQRAHLLVLYALMEKFSGKTGTAFPSRRGISDQEGLDYRTVENSLYELRLWGHIDWEKRAEPELHKGRLLHYTLPVLKWTEEELTKAILAHRETLRAKEPAPKDREVHRPGCTPPRVYTPEGDAKYTSEGDPEPSEREPENSTASSDEAAHATHPLDDPGQPGAAGDGARTKSKRATRRTQIAPGWRPTTELIAWVKRGWAANDRQIATEADKFRDHHTSKGSLMASWDAAWRTWWGNGYHKIPKRPDSAPGKSAAADDLAAELEKLRKEPGFR